jgi:acyl-CoA synthetase (NDP forming)
MTAGSIAPAPQVSPARMRGLFAPRSIAIVGASDNSVRSRALVDNLARGGYPGTVYFVNPRRQAAHGEATYAALTEVPEAVDLAFLVVGRDNVPSVMADAAEAGVANLAVMAAGYGEAGPDGIAKQNELAGLARQFEQLVFGPNNLGFVNARDRVMAFTTSLLWPFPEGGVGLVSQSGGMCRFALDYVVARDVGLSYLMSIGNQAVVNAAHVMDYLVDDPATRVIALYLETIRDPAEFRRVAMRALEIGKPIVACKLGRSAAGARAAAAHTGSLVGDDAIVDAVFRQLGIIRVDSIEDLVITAGVLDSYGVLPGSRVAVVTESGAATGVIGDVAEREGIELVDFHPRTVARLREVLPGFATPQNPLDVTGQSAADLDLRSTVDQIVIEDPNADVVVLMAPPPLVDHELTPSRDATLRRTAGMIDRAEPRVVIASYLMSDYGDFARRYIAEIGLPMALPGIEKGLPALARALRWSERFRRSSLPHSSSDVGCQPDPPIGAFDDTSPWSEVRARDHLIGIGVPVVPGHLVVTAGEAVAAADQLGYPVALKAVSPTLAHKSDIGAVALHLADPAAVRTAHATVVGAARDAAIDGVLVTAMRSGGIEMIVGVVHDPLWGPVLAVGMGGIWAEIIGDVAQRVLPVTRADIGAMLDELRARPLLHGARGREPVDLDALIDVIAGIASAALVLGSRLEALEVNPLWVSGAQIEALDALVTWQQPK